MNRKYNQIQLVSQYQMDIGLEKMLVEKKKKFNMRNFVMLWFKLIERYDSLWIFNDGVKSEIQSRYHYVNEFSACVRACVSECYAQHFVIGMIQRSIVGRRHSVISSN